MQIKLPLSKSMQKTLQGSKAIGTSVKSRLEVISSAVNAATSAVTIGATLTNGGAVTIDASSLTSDLEMGDQPRNEGALWIDVIALTGVVHVILTNSDFYRGMSHTQRRNILTGNFIFQQVLDKTKSTEGLMLTHYLCEGAAESLRSYFLEESKADRTGRLPLGGHVRILTASQDDEADVKAATHYILVQACTYSKERSAFAPQMSSPIPTRPSGGVIGSYDTSGDLFGQRKLVSGVDQALTMLKRRPLPTWVKKASGLLHATSDLQSTDASGVAGLASAVGDVLFILEIVADVSAVFLGPEMLIVAELIAAWAAALSAAAGIVSLTATSVAAGEAIFCDSTDVQVRKYDETTDTGKTVVIFDNGDFYIPVVTTSQEARLTLSEYLTL